MAYNTSAIKSDGRLIIDMANEIAMMTPSEAPFVAFTKRIASETANNPRFDWLERDLEARADQTSAAVADGVITTIPVKNIAYFRVGMVIKVPRTGEVMIVTAVSTDLTVKRGYGETTSAALNINEDLLIIGNANEEFAKAPGDAGGSPVQVYNFTQIFRTPFAVTNTANASKIYGSDKLITQEQKDKGVLHRIDMERAFLFGERYEDLTGTHPKRTTRGLIKFLSKNNTNVADGHLTEKVFINFLEPIFATGSDKKVLLASPRLLSVMSQWGVNRLQTNSGASQKYGFSISSYICAHGELTVVKEPLFTGTVYGGCGAVLDMNDIKYKPLNGRDTSLKTNIQDNDEDGRRDEYLTEAGLKVQLPAHHGFISGVVDSGV